jgi:hypothetical protein
LNFGVVFANIIYASFKPNEAKAMKSVVVMGLVGTIVGVVVYYASERQKDDESSQDYQDRDDGQDQDGGQNEDGGGQDFVFSAEEEPEIHRVRKAVRSDTTLATVVSLHRVDTMLVRHEKELQYPDPSDVSIVETRHSWEMVDLFEELEKSGLAVSVDSDGELDYQLVSSSEEEYPETLTLDDNTSIGTRFALEDYESRLNTQTTELNSFVEDTDSETYEEMLLRHEVELRSLRYSSRHILNIEIIDSVSYRDLSEKEIAKLGEDVDTGGETRRVHIAKISTLYPSENTIRSLRVFDSLITRHAQEFDSSEEMIRTHWAEKEDYVFSVMTDQLVRLDHNANDWIRWEYLTSDEVDIVIAVTDPNRDVLPSRVKNGTDESTPLRLVYDLVVLSKLMDSQSAYDTPEFYDLMFIIRKRHLKRVEYNANRDRFALYDLGPVDVKNIFNAVNTYGLPSRAYRNVDQDTPESVVEALVMVSDLMDAQSQEEDTTNHDADFKALISFIEIKYLVNVHFQNNNPDVLAWSYLGPNQIRSL